MRLPVIMEIREMIVDREEGDAQDDHVRCRGVAGTRQSQGRRRKWLAALESH